MSEQPDPDTLHRQRLADLGELKRRIVKIGLDQREAMRLAKELAEMARGWPQQRKEQP